MTEHLTTEDLDRIEKAARTIAEDGGGRWETAIDEDLSHPGSVVVLAGTKNQVCGSDFEGYRTCLSDEDAEHIAAADPATVLALVEEVHRLRALADDPKAVEATRDAVYRALSGKYGDFTRPTADQARSILCAALNPEDKA